MSSPTKTLRVPAPDGPTMDWSKVPKLGPGGLSEWLSKFQVNALLEPNFSLVIIDAQATWQQALETLTRRHVLSAPIFDRDTKSFIGLVDVVDLLTYALKMIRDVHVPKEELEEWAFKSLPVKLMKDVSLRNPWCPTYVGKPMTSLVDMFSSRVSLHRVPLVDQDGKVVGLVSQSRLIQFLAEHRSMIGDALKVSIEQVMKSPVLSVNGRMPTIEALDALLKSRVSGLAVVNDDGCLIGQLSASDVKGAALAGDIWSTLYMPVAEFLALSAKHLEKRAHVLTAFPDQTLAQAIALLASSHHLHRVFVLSEDHKPVGVLSMGNVMEAISTRRCAPHDGACPTSV